MSTSPFKKTLRKLNPSWGYAFGSRENTNNRSEKYTTKEESLNVQITETNQAINNSCTVCCNEFEKPKEI